MPSPAFVLPALLRLCFARIVVFFSFWRKPASFVCPFHSWAGHWQHVEVSDGVGYVIEDHDPQEVAHSKQTKMDSRGPLGTLRSKLSLLPLRKP
jgi:hypothetical protein